MDLRHFEHFDSYVPLNLFEPKNWFLAFGVLLFFICFRYFLMVIPFQVIFYAIRPKAFEKRRIYPELPGRKEQLYEMRWSLLSSLVFAGAGLIMGIFWQAGVTQIYLPFNKYPLWYLPLSWVLLLLLHDSYFYWTHRWLHRKGVYEKFHLVHHRSLRPSPWASFSFHPVESLINAAALPLLILILPLHPVILLWHLTFMTLSAITNHLGYEILPSTAIQYRWGRYLISGLHHAQHHRYFRCNYGLFFSLWDRLCGTERADYEEEFAKLMKKPSHVGARGRG